MKKILALPLIALAALVSGCEPGVDANAPMIDVDSVRMIELGGRQDVQVISFTAPTNPDMTCIVLNSTTRFTAPGCFPKSKGAR